MNININKLLCILSMMTKVVLVMDKKQLDKFILKETGIRFFMRGNSVTYINMTYEALKLYEKLNIVEKQVYMYLLDEMVKMKYDCIPLKITTLTDKLTDEFIYENIIKGKNK